VVLQQAALTSTHAPHRQLHHHRGILLSSESVAASSVGAHKMSCGIGSQWCGGYRRWYDSSDDNRDDNCSPNNGHHRRILGVSCLVTSSARSWQCGGQGFESRSSTGEPAGQSPGDLEASEFLNEFSANRLYAGAPMFRMRCFAYQANASWARFGYGAI
jgi:hypothetical protein